MNTKPLTKEQLKRMKESWDALGGHGPYTKATDAEPTDEQLKEIRQSFHLASARKTNKSSMESVLFNKHYDKLHSLGLSDEYSGVQFRQFQNDAWSDTHLKNVPPSNPKKLKLFNDSIYEYVTEHTLYKLRFANLTKKRGVPLTESCLYVKKAFMEAIERNDINFFARVGDVLRKRQMKPKFWEESSAYDDLEVFLCVHWVKEFDGVKPLYNLSIKELSKICHDKLPDIRTLDAVEKRRQRLGLLRFKKNASKTN